VYYYFSATLAPACTIASSLDTQFLLEPAPLLEPQRLLASRDEPSLGTAMPNSPGKQSTAAADGQHPALLHQPLLLCNRAVRAVRSDL